MFEGFTLRRIEGGDRATFKTGHEDFTALKTFFRTSAHKFEIQHLARTYVLHDDVENRLAAYITIVCSEITAGETPPVPADDFAYPYRQWPAVKISRLLVDSRYRHDGPKRKEGVRIGEGLVKFVLGIAAEQICPAVGCRFVVLDAKKQAIDFYKKLGFRILDTKDNFDRDAPIMFLDLNSSTKNISSEELASEANDAHPVEAETIAAA